MADRLGATPETPGAVVSTMNPFVKKIEAPEALRGLPGWLLWKFEHHVGEPKPRKVPYYVNGSRRHGVQGRAEDRKQLVTFEVARAAAAKRGFDGIGFAPLPDFGVVALDFDRCVSDGLLNPDVENLVSCTYAEFSPSGNGVRAFFKGDVGNGKAHDGPFGFETFSTKGFVTFTGNVLDVASMLGNENTVADLTEEIKTLCLQRFGNRATAAEFDDPLMSYEPPIGLSIPQLTDALDVLPDDLPYESNTGPSWLSIGMAIHHETSGSDEGFQLWDDWSRKSPKYTTEEYGRAKWESFGKGGHRPTTARSLVRWAQDNGAYINMSLATTADFEAAAQTTDTKNTRFHITPAAEFSRGAHPGWIVKGVIPAAELIVLFGDSGSGKSFIATDISMAIARGVDWRGLRTRKGRVVYVAAEGSGGFRKRLSAYAIHNAIELDGIPFGVLDAAPNIMQKADAIDLAKAVVVSGGADLIVLDTFAQVTPGANENAGEDIGKALAHCRGISKATGATVVLVHHSGKDASKGARGWSGLRAAADAQLEVVRSAAGRMLTVDKQKDGGDAGEWGFELQVIPVGIDEDGDVIDSCVVKEAPLPLMGKGAEYKKGQGPWGALVKKVIEEIAIGQTSGIEIDEVLKEVVRRAPPAEEGKRDTRKQRAQRALSALCEGDDAPYFVENGCITVL